jgi:uncharacterized protein
VTSNRQKKRPANRSAQSARPTTSRNTDLENKRQRFEEAGKFPLRKVVIYVSVIAVVALLGAAGYSKVQASKQVSSGVTLGQGSGAAAPSGSASGGNVVMTPIDLAVDGANATFAVADVQKSTLVSMKYPRTSPLPGVWQNITGGTIPLIAYVAPSGNLVVATSFCEPCKSTSFHIEGNTLVCNTCFTKWDLNTLQGVSGGCTAFPPQALTVQNQNGTIVVPTANLESWTPRV